MNVENRQDNTVARRELSFVPPHLRNHVPFQGCLHDTLLSAGFPNEERKLRPPDDNVTSESSSKDRMQLASLPSQRPVRLPVPRTRTTVLPSNLLSHSMTLIEDEFQSRKTSSEAFPSTVPASWVRRCVEKHQSSFNVTESIGSIALCIALFVIGFR